MMLTMSLLVVFFLLIGTIGSVYVENYDWRFTLQLIGFLFGGGIALVFFGGVATTIPHYNKYEIIEPKTITKSETAVFVEFVNFETQEYRLKSEYDNIDSTTIFLKRTPYNYYNFEIMSPSIIYKNKTEKDEALELLNKKIYD